MIRRFATFDFFCCGVGSALEKDVVEVGEDCTGIVVVRCVVDILVLQREQQPDALTSGR